MTTTEYIILTVLLISAIILVKQDVKTKSVNIINLSVFGLASTAWYVIHGHASFVFFVIIMCTGLFTRILLKKRTVGNADYLVSLFVSPFLYNKDISILLILIGIIGIFTSLLTKSIKIAFIPIILFAVIITNLFRFLY